MMKRWKFGLFTVAAVIFTVIMPRGTASEPSLRKDAGSESDESSRLPCIRIASVAPGDDFIRLAAQAFTTANADIRLVLTRPGAAIATEKLNNGEIDLLLAVNPPSSAASVLELRKPFVAVVNPAVMLENLSFARLRRIYLGDIRGWDELGGDNLPIRLVAFAPGVPDRALLDILMRGFPPDTPREFTVKSGRAPAAVVAAESAAFGVMPMEFLNDSVKVLSIDGVAPTADNIVSGKYVPTIRYVLLRGSRMSPHTARFVDFLHSREGVGIYHFLSLIYMKAEHNE